MFNRTKKNATSSQRRIAVWGSCCKRRVAVWGSCFLIAAALLLTVKAGFGQSWNAESPRISHDPQQRLANAELPKMSDDLQGRLAKADADSKVDVIIQFKQHPTAYHLSKVERLGGKMKRDLRGVIKGAAFTVPASAVADLANDPDVAYISPDRPLQGMQSALSATLDYYDATIYAPWAWQLGLNGTGVGVAVIDSGIIDVPDLQAPTTGSFTPRTL
jgi:hypothetical protein